MAIYKKGADPVALRSSADRLSAHARDCDGIRGEASRAMHALKGQWGGGDLDHLMSRWPPIDAQLGQFGTHLDGLAATLRRNAQEQDTASGLGGSMPSGMPGSPSGPGLPASPGGPDTPEDDGRSVLSSLGLGTTMASLPIVLGQTVGVLSTFSKADGWMKSGQYLSAITQMAKTGDPLFDLLPAASKVGGISNLTGDLWGMSGLSGLFAEGSAASKVVGKFGVLGPIGIGLSAVSAISNFAQGNVSDGVLDTVGTGLAAGAVFAPPPVNVVCGVAGLGLAAYQNIPFVHDTVNAIGSGIADGASAVGNGVADAASGAWDTVTGWF